MFNNQLFTNKLLGICKSANEDGATFIDIVGSLHTVTMLHECWYLKQERDFQEKERNKVKKYVIKNKKKMNK